MTLHEIIDRKNDDIVSEKTWIPEHALEFLGDEHELQAWQFTNLYQLKALKILGKDAADQALQFTKKTQVKALEILGNEHWVQASQFTKDSQWRALKILGKNAAAQALQCTDDDHLIVLELLGKEHADQVPLFKTDRQLIELLCFEACLSNCDASELPSDFHLTADYARLWGCENLGLAWVDGGV